MVVSGFYQLHGVFVTEDERQRLMKANWVDAEEPLPGENLLRCAKDKRCYLVQIPHGYEDLEADEWFFGVGEIVYFGASEEIDDDDDRPNNYAKYTPVELFDLIKAEIKFGETEAEMWRIPNDCPCCS